MIVDDAAHAVALHGGCLDSLDGLTHVGRQEEYVVAGEHRHELGPAAAVAVGYAFHVHAVGDDEAVETHGTFEEAVDDGGTERGGMQAVVGVDLQVGHHDAPHAGGEEAAEGVQVDGVDIGEGVVDDGQLEVTVFVGVAMAGEMLGHSHDSLALLSEGVHDGEACHTLRVGAEGAGADDGVVGVGVDVGHWGEVDMDAHLAALAPYLFTHTVDDAVSILGELTEARVAGKGVHVIEAHTEPPFAVDAHHQRHTGVALEAVCKGGLPLGGADKETDTADAIAVHQLGEGFGLLVVHIERHTHDHELCDALVESQGLHDRVDPVGLRVTVCPATGTEALGHSLAEHGCKKHRHNDGAYSLFHCLNSLSMTAT